MKPNLRRILHRNVFYSTRNKVIECWSVCLKEHGNSIGICLQFIEKLRIGSSLFLAKWLIRIQ